MSEEGQMGGGHALLLVAFGTTVPEAQDAFLRIDERARSAFPEATVRWAYTSKIIRRKLAAGGIVLDSPEIALARLMDEGFRDVVLLPLHVFPGREFHDLQHNTTLFSKMTKGFQTLKIAHPLLASYEDLVRVAEVLVRDLPESRRRDEAVVFVGHGNRAHPADMVYTALAHELQRIDPRVFVGTIQGRPGPSDLFPDLQRRNVTTAWLIPLMTVAGEHARQDMAGDRPESWKSVLSHRGITSHVVLTGLAENPAIVEVWLDHLREVLVSGVGAA